MRNWNWLAIVVWLGAFPLGAYLLFTRPALVFAVSVICLLFLLLIKLVDEFVKVLTEWKNKHPRHKGKLP